jgi:hypothetical protein
MNPGDFKLLELEHLIERAVLLADGECSPSMCR